MKKVSIIIPAYNAETTIEKCINSVINQTYKNIEIIVINDGSKDNTAKICEKYAEDNRFTLINKENEGVSVARNTGIIKSTGDYIVFVDSDDYIPENAVENLVSKKHLYNVDLVCASFEFIKTRNRTEKVIVGKKCFKGNEYSENIEEILNTIYTGPVGKIFDSKIIREHNILFPLNISFGEDAIFVYEYLQYIQSIYFDDTIVYYYDIRELGSLSRSYNENFYNDIFRILQAKIELVKKYKMADIDGFINDNNIMGFNQCLMHYIIYEKNKDKLYKYIKLATIKFQINNSKNDYATLIENDRLDILIKKWKLKNIKIYIKEQIKLLFDNFN